MNICTIIARNYAAHARVLAELFKGAPPRRCLQRAGDRRPEGLPLYLAEEPFEIVTIDQIGLPDPERMAAS